VSGNFIAASVAFTDFRLGEQSLLAVKNNILPDGLSPAKPIYLSHQQNVFSFDFDILHFSNPLNNQCLYKLENYDDKWRQPGTERSASYFNVPPGHYTFRVKAANSNGIWIEKFHHRGGKPGGLTPFSVSYSCPQSGHLSLTVPANCAMKIAYWKKKSPSVQPS